MESYDFAQMLRDAANEQHTMMSTNLASIFVEEPVSLACFIQDAAYLGNPPLSPIQYEAVRHIERIYYPELYPLMAEFDRNKQPGRLHVGPVSAWREEPYWSLPCRMCNFITLQWGKGSGKDHSARVASMRIAYLLLCLDSPQQYFGMPEQDTIHLLNVASNSHQARDAFFTPMTKAVKNGWFKHRADPKQNVIDYDKNIVSISGHSDAESQEGLNLLLAVADEIDAFKSKKETVARRGGSGREPTKSAEGILNMIRTSGSTRFPQVFKNVRISFPRYLGSTIQRLTAEGKADINKHKGSSRHFVSGPLATWEVNPRVPGPEAFAQDYEEDPVMARAKYECQPARAINPYFRNVQAVDAAFETRQIAPIDVQYRVETGSNDRAVWSPDYVFSPDLFPVRGAIYAMHGDLAVTGDRAGIAMAHVTSYTEHQVIAEDEDGAQHVVREVRPNVKVDFVLSFTSDASADPPREIQIRWARQLCFELVRRGFNIRRFTFDIFQSRDSMQILEAKGIECERVSTDTSEDPYRTLRDLMYEGRLIVPRPPVPADKSFLLRDELLSLTRLNNGKIDHPADSSKDEADALACAVYGAIAVGGSEEAEDARAIYSGAEFEVHHMFELPFGVNPANIWENSLPEPF